MGYFGLKPKEVLASLCDCTPTHICNIENGKIGISLDLLLKISILLGKSMDYFVMDNPGVDPQVKIKITVTGTIKWKISAMRISRLFSIRLIAA